MDITIENKKRIQLNEVNIYDLVLINDRVAIVTGTRSLGDVTIAYLDRGSSTSLNGEEMVNRVKIKKAEVELV